MFNFYRDHEGLEVDVVRERSGDLELFEIKKSKVYKPDFTEPMKTFEGLVDNPIQKNVLYGGQSLQDDMVQVIGWKDF